MKSLRLKASKLIILTFEAFRNISNFESSYYLSKVIAYNLNFWVRKKDKIIFNYIPFSDESLSYFPEILRKGSDYAITVRLNKINYALHFIFGIEWACILKILKDILTRFIYRFINMIQDDLFILSSGMKQARLCSYGIRIGCLWFHIPAL